MENIHPFFFRSTVLFCLFSFLNALPAISQKQPGNLIIITYDGLRWQEVFGGLDSVLMNSKEFTDNAKEMKAVYDASTPEERRKKLLPFIWGKLAKDGQIHGNRRYGSKVNNANPHWFSYPGYNEIFTGFPDPAVNSNDKIDNQHENVLEFINKQKGYKGKVAAFTSWDVFPYILNEKRSKILVNSAWEDLKEGKMNDRIQHINELQQEAPRLIGGVRWDFLTWNLALEYLKANYPKVLYIGLDETDDFAHQGKYDFYIASAHKTDQWIGELWEFLQKDPFYKGNTTLLITTDHGRGDADKRTWKDHGKAIPDCSEMWYAILGPGIPVMGEVKTEEQVWQKQFAAAMAEILGFEFKAKHEIAPAIKTVTSKK